MYPFSSAKEERSQSEGDKQPRTEPRCGNRERRKVRGSVRASGSRCGWQSGGRRGRQLSFVIRQCGSWLVLTGARDGERGAGKLSVTPGPACGVQYCLFIILNPVFPSQRWPSVWGGSANSMRTSEEQQ